MTANAKAFDAVLEAQYNIRALRPNYDTAVVPRWVSASEAFRATANAVVDIVYGPGPRQKLDIFRSGVPDAPVFIYFHGGYWQRGDKSIYSFIAEPFVRHGVDVVIAGYDLCPDVSMTRLTEESREAISWLAENGDAYGLSVDRLIVAGHSAGGHIAEMLAGTDWPSRNAAFPSDLIKAFVPISPLSVLGPLLSTSINNALKMDEEEASALSPLNNPPLTCAPQLVVVGGAETEGFHYQADIYAQAFATETRSIRRYDVPGCDHFDELDQLANEGSEFFALVMELITGAGEN